MNLFVLPKHLGLPRDEHVVSDVTEMHDARVRDVPRELLGVAANHDATPRHELIDRRAFRSVFGLVSRVGQQDVGRRGEIQQREKPAHERSNSRDETPDPVPSRGPPTRAPWPRRHRR